MKIYRGIREKCGASVTVDESNAVSKLDPRLDLRNHSPTGFEWGYGGSGPAQLALAILADYYSDDQFALGHYQNFKFKVIGRIQDDEWVLAADAIEAAMQELLQGKGKLTNG